MIGHMMTQFLKLLEVQSVLFVYLAVGIFCRKKGIFTDEVQGKLSDFAMFITLPCMVFESFHMEFSWAVLKQSGQTMLAALMIVVASMFLGNILYRGIPRERKCVMRYGTLLSNCTFAGVPFVDGIYGAEGVYIGAFFAIPMRIMMWTVGISSFAEEGRRKRDAIVHVMRLPAVVAVYLGLIRMAVQFPVPAFLDTALTGIGDCTTPLAMALVGAILADAQIKDLFEPLPFCLAFVRQILIPGLSLMAMRALSVDPLITGVSVILTGMPLASTTAILAQKYSADAQFASKCVFVSTLTSLITVPVLALFL